MRTYRTFTPDPRFPQSKVRYAVPDAPTPTPPTPTYTITGVVARSGTVISGAGIEFTSLGTVTTDGSGVYTQTVTQGYSGTALPHYAYTGSFTPASIVYSNVVANASAQNYDFYISPGTESVVLTRPGVFALSFVVNTSTGYLAVQDSFGNIVIHASGDLIDLDFSVTSCTVWPCFSATDAFNTGNITLIGAGANGLAGDLDLSLLTKLAFLAVADQQLTSITFTSASTLLTDIAAQGNGMGASETNAILVAADSTGAINGSLSLTNNSVPSGAGAAAKTSLQGKGWFVDTD